MVRQWEYYFFYFGNKRKSNIREYRHCEYKILYISSVFAYGSASKNSSRGDTHFFFLLSLYHCHSVMLSYLITYVHCPAFCGFVYFSKVLCSPSGNMRRMSCRGFFLSKWKYDWNGQTCDLHRYERGFPGSGRAAHRVDNN